MQSTFQVDLSPKDEHGLKHKFKKINEYSYQYTFRKYIKTKRVRTY